MTAKPLLLIDGSYYIYRSYFALPPLSTRSGQPTGAVRGAVNALQKLLKQYHPTHIAVVFDPPGPTFRHEMAADYKAHRPPTPDDLKAQFEPLKQLVRAMGIPVLCVDGFEGDDVIGTLAKLAERHGQDVIISTADKDMTQLVNERITIVNPFTDKDGILDPAGVEAKFGVRPDQIIDYLALVGDASDGIAGVQGVGPKTAVKWLQAWGSLDNLIANGDQLTGKVGETFRNSLDQVRLSRTLATIHCEAPVDLDIDGLVRRDSDREALKAIYTELEFSGLLATLDATALPAVEDDEAPSAPPIATRYHTVTTQSAYDALLKRLTEARAFSFDTETTSLNYREARIVGFSVSLEVGEAYYVPLAHDYLGAPEQLDRNAALAAIKPILENEHIGKIGQHLKYDTHVLANHGITLRGVVFDTMLASYVLDATATRHNMDDLARHYLNYQTTTFEEIAGKGVKQLTFDRIELEPASAYACEDADITLRLKEHFQPLLLAEPKLNHLFHELEMPVAPILQQMEAKGALLDFPQLQRLSENMAKRLAELETQAHAIAGMPFNVASPKQLGEVLFDKLMLPGGKKTASGQYATGEDVLEGLDHELAKVVLEHRGSEQAEGHLHRQAAAVGRSGIAPHPYLVSPGGGGNGAAVVVGPQSAEHSGAHGRGTDDPSGLHCAAGLQAGVGGLFADRAAADGAPEPRCAPAGSVYAGRGCAQGDGGGGDGRAAGGGDERDAAGGEGDQFRAVVRDVGLRAGEADQCVAAAGAGVYRAVFQPVSGGEALYGRDAGAGGEAGFCGDAVRAEAAGAGDQQQECGDAPGGGAGGDQCAVAGVGGGHYQAGDDCGGCATQAAAV
jgi:DNA polymerase-1